MEKVSTEQKILDAAEKVFLRAGYDGARMQEIADLAEINKAMLHYYFRSKDALFEKIFENKAKQFFPEISEVLKSDISFTQKTDSFIDAYIGIMMKYPFIPLFVLNVVNKPNPTSFIEKMPTDIVNLLAISYHDALAKNEVRELNPMQLMISIMGMCAFPFLARPVIQHIGNLSQNDFMALMELRKQEVKTYVRLILAK